MRKEYQDERLPDDSPTDELPVLSELDVVDDFDAAALFRGVDEDESTGTHSILRLDPREGAADAAADAAALEASHAVDAAQLADKDATIASLAERLEATRQAVGRRDETEGQLRAELAEREAVERQLRAELAERETIERQLRAELAEREAAGQRQRAELADSESAEARLRGRLAELEAGEQELRARLAERDDAEHQLLAQLEERESQLAERERPLIELEADVARREADVARRERALVELDARLANREAAAAALEAQLAEREKAVESTEARLAERDAQLAEQHALRLESETRLASLEARLAEREELSNGASAHDAASVAAASAAGSAELKEALEARAALAGYIENRRAHWQEMETRVAEQQSRIVELERELDHRAVRQQEAVRLAELESRRVGDLKEEIAKLRRLLETRRDREAKPGPARPSRPEAVGDDATLQAKGADIRAAAPAAAGEDSTELRTQPERLGAGLAAREAALADREAKLREHAEQRDQLRQRLTESSTQLDQARNVLRRLERILVDRDHALDVKNSRIESLEAELASNPSAGPAEAHPPSGGSAATSATTPLPSLGRASATAPLPSLDAASPAAPPLPAGAAPGVPSLVCLTSDSPLTYPLRKPAITIGRSGQCEIQIATHFVSREHARVTTDGDAIVIEDLGSKNGVFVNSVRVEREALRHGDLVTVGETQFRFLVP